MGSTAWAVRDGRKDSLDKIVSLVLATGNIYNLAEIIDNNNKMGHKVSPFIYPGLVASADHLAILHLRRDQQIPTILKDRDNDNDGYTEGKVVNTRFGSFPHSTLIGQSWGSQARASIVDTGSRGRRAQGNGNKRKREESEQKDLEYGGDGNSTPSTKDEKILVQAHSGFIHILPPTPENWTSSLPHRTQVVYTPDYSYILHRIRARPGTAIIEAGAGSGSFTHASARAVFNGSSSGSSLSRNNKHKRGQVYSYEFHEQRHSKLQQEIEEHGLEDVVQITHRDVCEEGFLIKGESPNAESIFLDLPAPWLALPHLTRSPPPDFTSNSPSSAHTNEVLDHYPESNLQTANSGTQAKPFISPLNPNTTIHICTFSPCIEQVQRTISMLRQLGWLSISMVEVVSKRLEIRRERIGIDVGTQRGVQATAASVSEAIGRLIEVDTAFKSYHENGFDGGDEKRNGQGKKAKENQNNREKIIESLVEKKVYKEGRLVHRTEPEVKNHTSYLVFAVLPREWSKEDEENARQKWAVNVRSIDKANGKDEEGQKVIGMSRKQIRRAEEQAERAEKATARANDEEIANGNVKDVDSGLEE
ncbi:hypothetical protein B7494_g429 [Chlorociboria aeruginascens]|nr:hypothetical protein B7494_g429 [Chlorociboria aeruginascens]